MSRVVADVSEALETNDSALFGAKKRFVVDSESVDLTGGRFVSIFGATITVLREER